MNDSNNTTQDAPKIYSKKHISIMSLNSLAQVLKDQNNGDFQILLLTSYGFITGDISEIVDSSNMLTSTDTPNNFSLNLSFILNDTNNYISKLKEENPNIKQIDNGSTIYLRNVKIYRNGLADALAHPVVSLEQFFIFTDQILGYSLIPQGH